jgi:hypothetical protein
MREETFDHNKIKGLVEEKKDLVTKGRVLSQEIEEKQEELKKLGMKVQKVKDKLIPAVEKDIEPDIDLDEFEEIYSIDLNEDGEVVVNVNDRVEEFKQSYRDQKEKQKEEALNE